MKLTHVGISGFKGGTGEYPLSGLDVFTGPNGSGKTRILQAVQLALSGNVPHAIEDRNIETIELFPTDGNNEMQVSVLCEGNSALPYISRHFGIGRAAGKDSVKQTVGIGDSNGEMKLADAEKLINEATGNWKIMLDVHEFIRMSDAKRAALIFQFAQLDKDRWNEKVVEGMLHNAVQKYSDEHLVAVYNKVIGTINGGAMAIGIKAALDFLKEKSSSLKKEYKESQAASLGSIKSSSTDGKSSLRHVEDIEADIAKTRADRDALVKSIEQTKAVRQAWARLTQEKNELVVKIEAKRKEVNPDAIAQMKERVVAIQKSIAEAPDHAAELVDVQNKLNLERGEYVLAEKFFASCQRDVLDAEERAEHIKSGTCPTCLQPTKSVLGEIANRLTSLKLRADSAHDDQTNIGERVNALTLQEGIVKDSIDVVSKATWDWKNEEAALVTRVASSDGSMEYLLSMQKDLERLNKTKIEGEMINLDEAELQLNGLTTSGAALNLELDGRKDYDTKITLAKETHLKAKRAEESLELVGALTEKLTEIRWHIVRDTLEPIRKEAAELFAAAGQKAEFDFAFKDRRGNEVFRFGWKFAGEVYDSFVDFDSLSTAQQLFTLVSLLGPLIHRGNPKFRLLILDNVEILDNNNRHFFTALLLKAKGRYFDNVIVASSAPMPLAEGVTVHQL